MKRIRGISGSLANGLENENGIYLIICFISHDAKVDVLRTPRVHTLKATCR